MHVKCKFPSGLICFLMQQTFQSSDATFQFPPDAKVCTNYSPQSWQECESFKALKTHVYRFIYIYIFKIFINL